MEHLVIREVLNMLVNLKTERDRGKVVCIWMGKFKLRNGKMMLLFPWYELIIIICKMSI
jgi:hypothetical protein